MPREYSIGGLITFPQLTGSYGLVSGLIGAASLVQHTSLTLTLSLSRLTTPTPDQSSPLLRPCGQALEMGPHAGVNSRPLHPAAVGVRPFFLLAPIRPPTHHVPHTYTNAHYYLSLQTVAMATLSIHAACNIQEPAKRQQMSNVLAALNIGSACCCCCCSLCATTSPTHHSILLSVQMA